MSARRRTRRKSRRDGLQSLPAPVLGAWLRYYVGRGLQLAGILFVTSAGVLFFGADAERRMLVTTGIGAALFLGGWLLAKRKPPTED